MYDSNSKGISYTAGFFMLIGFVVVAIFIAGIISIPIWTSMTGTSFEDMEKNIDNPAYADAARVIQIITAFVGFFLPTLLTAFLLNRKPLKLLGYAGHVRWGQIGLVIVIILVGLFVSTGLSYFNSHLPIPANWKAYFDKAENDYNSSVESLINLSSFPQYLLALFMLAFLPAFCEETLFRGGLQNFLTRSTKKPWLSIIIVSILFSLAHWSYYGFFARISLGIILGLLYQYSGKIWLNILGHFLNNAIAITVLYFYTMNGKPLKDAMNEDSESFWGILALPVLIALIVYFYKISKKDKAALEAVQPPPANDPNNLFS